MQLIGYTDVIEMLAFSPNGQFIACSYLELGLSTQFNTVYWK